VQNVELRHDPIQHYLPPPIARTHQTVTSNLTDYNITTNIEHNLWQNTIVSSSFHCSHVWYKCKLSRQLG